SGPAAALTNAMRRPSGDHAGDPCAPIGWPGCVSARAAPPSRPAIQIVDGMFALYATGEMSTHGSDWKAIERLSGDHVGRDPKGLTCRATPPSAGTVQMPPRRREWKAMSVASGDHAGCTFCPPS